MKIRLQEDRPPNTHNNLLNVEESRYCLRNLLFKILRRNKKKKNSGIQRVDGAVQGNANSRIDVLMTR